MAEPMNPKVTISEIYCEFVRREEALIQWRKGMYDKIRNEARERTVALREVFQADEVEQTIRDIAKDYLYTVADVETVVSLSFVVTNEKQGVVIKYYAWDYVSRQSLFVSFEQIDDIVAKGLAGNVLCGTKSINFKGEDNESH